MGREFHDKRLPNAQSSKNIAFLPVLPESKKPIWHSGRLLYGNRKINITSTSNCCWFCAFVIINSATLLKSANISTVTLLSPSVIPWQNMHSFVCAKQKSKEILLFSFYKISQSKWRATKKLKQARPLPFKSRVSFFCHHDKKNYPFYQTKNSLEAKIVCECAFSCIRRVSCVF